MAQAKTAAVGKEFDAGRWPAGRVRISKDWQIERATEYSAIRRAGDPDHKARRDIRSVRANIDGGGSRKTNAVIIQGICQWGRHYFQPDGPDIHLSKIDRIDNDRRGHRSARKRNMIGNQGVIHTVGSRPAEGIKHRDGRIGVAGAVDGECSCISGPGREWIRGLDCNDRSVGERVRQRLRNCSTCESEDEQGEGRFLFELPAKTFQCVHDWNLSLVRARLCVYVTAPTIGDFIKLSSLKT